MSHCLLHLLHPSGSLFAILLFDQLNPLCTSVQVLLAQAQPQGDGAFSYGMASSFEFAPPGFTIETVVAASSKGHESPGDQEPVRLSMPTGGTNAALAEYGDFILARHGKKRAGPNVTNEVAHLGYSTTGFYFYNFCDCLDPDFTHQSKTCKNPNPNLPGCRTYEDTLYAVVDKLKEQGIPIKHVLLDSWWYVPAMHAAVRFPVYMHSRT